jgi:capsular polysaccharide biosynthesis protein/Tfp pilus assembly protein PilF
MTASRQPDAHALHMAGFAARRRGDGQAARGLMRRSLLLAPAAADCWTNLGVVERDRGRPESARLMHRRAELLAPGLYQVHANLANAHDDLGRHAEAARAGRRRLLLRPGDASGCVDLARVLGRGLRAEEALSVLRRATMAGRPSAALALVESTLLTSLKRTGAAARVLAHAAAAFPGEVQLHANLARIRRDRGEWPGATAAARRAMLLEPGAAPFLKLAEGSLVEGGAAPSDRFRRLFVQTGTEAPRPMAMSAVDLGTGTRFSADGHRLLRISRSEAVDSPPPPGAPFRLPEGMLARFQSPLLTPTSHLLLAGGALYHDGVTPYSVVDAAVPVHDVIYLTGHRRAVLAMPDRLQRIDRPHIVIGTGGSPNHFHWLVDFLSRLVVLEAFTKALPELATMPLLLGAHATQVVRELLPLLGFGAGGITIAEAGAAVEAPELLVPAMAARDRHGTAAFAALLRQRLAGTMAGLDPGPRRIYVSRSGAGARRVRNEADVEAMLAAEGFAIARLDNLPAVEQVRLFAAAETIVGPHGAGLANIVFAPAGCRVIELNYESDFSNLYRGLSLRLGHGYRAVRCPRVTVSRDRPGKQDISVPLDRLRAALAEAG